MEERELMISVNLYKVRVVLKKYCALIMFKNNYQQLFDITYPLFKFPFLSEVPYKLRSK